MSFLSKVYARAEEVYFGSEREENVISKQGKAKV